MQLWVPASGETGGVPATHTNALKLTQRQKRAKGHTRACSQHRLKVHTPAHAHVDTRTSTQPTQPESQSPVQDFRSAWPPGCGERPCCVRRSAWEIRPLPRLPLESWATRHQHCALPVPVPSTRLALPCPRSVTGAPAHSLAIEAHRPGLKAGQMAQCRESQFGCQRGHCRRVIHGSLSLVPESPAYLLE